MEEKNAAVTAAGNAPRVKHDAWPVAWEYRGYRIDRRGSCADGTHRYEIEKNGMESACATTLIKAKKLIDLKITAAQQLREAIADAEHE